MWVYETEYRVTPTDATDDVTVNWRTIPERPREGVGSISIEGLDLGVSYDVRVRMVDPETGGVTAWTLWPGVVVEKDAIAPPAVSSLRLTKENCVVWEMPAEILDLRGFRIRHAPGQHGGWDDGWGTAERAHEEIVTAPPFVLCRVPKGHRTILIRPVDWDDNEGPVTKIVTNRGPIDDQAEFLVRTVDEAANGFLTGTLRGASASAPLLADVEPPPSTSQPMFPSGIEPWMSVDPYAPMFPLDEEAPMFGETWGLEAPWWPRSSNAPMFGDLYQWMEYVWSFTVHAGEGGPGAVLSIDCACTGVGWRLMYRQHNDVAWFPDNPFEAMFDPDPAAAMFPENAVKPWRPWPGRLLDVGCGQYDFRLIVPGGHEQAEVSALSVSLSNVARTRHVTGLSVPANGGTRVPPGDPWRKIVEVKPTPVGTSSPRLIPVTSKSGAKGANILTLDQASGAEVATLVDVVVRGY